MLTVGSFSVVLCVRRIVLNNGLALFIHKRLCNVVQLLMMMMMM